MISTLFKTAGFSFAVLVLGEMVTLGGQPLSHHAVDSVHWTTRVIQESSLWQNSAGWIRERGIATGKWVGRLGWKSSTTESAAPATATVPSPIARGEQITTADRQALRALIREKDHRHK